MTRSRLLPALALAAGLFLTVGGTSAQPLQPGAQPPGVRPALVAEALAVVPKSAGAFVTLKVSDLIDHPDLKPVLAELAKQPDALAGITEVIGVPPQDLERVTLFWPRLDGRGSSDPVLVVTTRQPYNEARVIKALKAEPVFDGDLRGRGGRGGGLGGRGGHGHGAAAPKSAVEAHPPVVKPEPPPPPVEKKDPPGESYAASADAGPAEPLFYELPGGGFEALFLIDDRTLVFLPGGLDGEFATLALLAATLKKDATGPLADAIAAARAHTFAAGVNLAPLSRELDRRTPPGLAPYAALFPARTAVLTGDLGKSATLRLTLKFDDAAAARRGAPVLEEGIASVADKLAGLAAEMKEGGPPLEKAAAPLLGTFAMSLKKASVKADGTSVTASAEIEAGPVAAKAFGELLQAVQSRKKEMERLNHLKQIGLALHWYHDVNGKFPTNVYGPKGEPLLSWRVHLLPFLEQDNLYKQFKMDEPWDGPNNKKLVEKLPKVYQAPGRDHPQGMTFYQSFVGPDPQKGKQPKGVFGRPWLQQGDKEALRITHIADGTSNTIAVVEARDGVVWSKPDDLPFGGAVPPLGEKGWDRTPALRFDGSVFLVPTNLKPEQFWPLVTINGGEVTPDFDDERRPGLGRPPAAKDGGPVPPPEAGKPDGGGREARKLDIVISEQRLVDLKAALRKAEAEAEAQAVLTQRVVKLFEAGGATREEVSKAKAGLDVRKAEVELRRREVDIREAELKALKGGREK
jgi:hypothetical protein